MSGRESRLVRLLAVGAMMGAVALIGGELPAGSVRMAGMDTDKMAAGTQRDPCLTASQPDVGNIPALQDGGGDAETSPPYNGKPAKLRPLPKGISTWAYRYSDGMARQVARFNTRARPELQFRYLFPYAGSVGFTDEKGQVSVHYSSKATRAYARALPGVLMMPIVDGRTDNGEFNGWTEEQYREAARKVAERVIEDADAAGVQIDIEPFSADHLPFYRHLRELLNAEGKHCTMFVGPWGKELLTRIFQSCDIVVMSGYDLDGDGSALSDYRSAMERSVARFQQVTEETGGHYMIGIPAAASWGEYEYIAGGEGGRAETGVKQEEYVKAALDVVKGYRDCPEYIGVALWHMSDPETELEEPDKVTAPTKFPNIIRESVWKMLEDY